MSQLILLWYLSYRRPAKTQATTHWMPVQMHLKNEFTEDENTLSHELAQISLLKWSNLVSL